MRRERCLARVRRAGLLAALGIVAGTIVGSALAGPPGTWTRVTETNGRNIDEVGVARTGDGVLHVAWVKRAAPLQEEIWHAAIAPSGTLGAANQAAAGWNAVDNPDLVVLSDGSLRVFFGGLGDTIEEGGVQSASAAADGASWTPQGTRVSSTSSAVGPVGAALRPDGVPVFAYALSFVLGLHSGFDPGDADTDLRPEVKCCDYLPDVAFDSASGDGFIGWSSNVEGEDGLWVQQIWPSQGPRQAVPGSATNGQSIGIDQRTAISARRGAPGVYVAYCGGYPTCKSVLLWRLGSQKPVTVGRGTDVEDVNIAQGPDGRLWLVWQDPSVDRLYAARTNKAATRVGAIVSVRPQQGTETIWKVKGEGSLGHLDLLASLSTPGSLATWHTQVLPGLTLAAKKGAKSVVFTVSDAGDRVAGAKIKFGKKTLTTNSRGQATAPRASGKATASRRGYTPASLRVR